jgi:Amt family ammonium transporter
MPLSALPETATALCILLILLVPLAGAGLALINTGLGRSRSAAHSMLAALAVIAIAALVYFAFGFALQGFTGRPAHSLMIAGKPWNWIAAEPFFFRGLQLDGSAASLVAWLQLVCVGLAALIPLGAGADRWRLGAICIFTAMLAGFIYPLFAHWVWGGGWLAQLGVNYGLGRGFIDAGGASTIQVVGGIAALTISWLLGPRRGKYSMDGMPTAIPGHNIVYVLFGCLFALIGWIALNSAGAILFTGVDFHRVVLIAVNTTLAATAAMLAAAAITRTRFGKPDASLSANGWIGGLVAVSAACAFISPGSAVVIGVIAGALVTFSVEIFELRLAVDDPGGAISVHAIGGLWGIMAVGLFARFPALLQNVPVDPSRVVANSNSYQWLAQLLGVSTLLGFILPLTYGLNWLINRFYPQRVALEGERQGMDLHELGAGAYPEFITHTDEFMQR